MPLLPTTTRGRPYSSVESASADTAGEEGVAFHFAAGAGETSSGETPGVPKHPESPSPRKETTPLKARSQKPTVEPQSLSGKGCQHTRTHTSALMSF